jgi:hypothetical protein
MSYLQKSNLTSSNFDLVYTDNDPWKVGLSPWFKVHIELIRRLKKMSFFIKV